jgi:hypothetical protein
MPRGGTVPVANASSGLTVIRTCRVSLAPSASLAVKVTSDEPTVVGVPVSVPSGLSVRPAGSAVLE